MSAIHASTASDSVLHAHFSTATLNAPVVHISSDSGNPVPTAPLRVGVVFCGRQCPGGHNVVSGLFDSLPAGSTLLGFVGGELFR